jgi:stage V sporulation protein AD
MVNKKMGKQSISYTSPPYIVSTATIAGPMEGEGKIGTQYDKVLDDNINGEKSWEKCESYMLEWVIQTATQKGQLSINDIDVILAGDLLNQLMAAHFAVRNIGRPFLGLYGACSTLAEGTLVGSVLIDGGFAERVALAASSHHDAAERQYRFPTELGVQRPPTTQWTVTGSGAMVLAVQGTGPRVTAATIGKIVDMGLKDPNAMGPAMAPAAADTIYNHLVDTQRDPGYYDMIFTGDLGMVGKELTIQLLKEKGYDITSNYEDCGCMIYYDNQDVHSGASGCASSALAFCAQIYNQLQQKTYSRVLLVGTGCLHSPTSYQQKESIPCIAHAVAIEN